MVHKQFSDGSNSACISRFRALCGCERSRSRWPAPLAKPALFLPLFLQLYLLSSILQAYDGQTQDYVVRRGDTLYSLARGYGVSVNEVMRINELENSTELKPGMLLKIPTKNFPGRGRRSENRAESSYSTHVVARGETYYSIARKYSMSLKELLDLNGLDSGALLRPTQTLVVRSPAAGDRQPDTDNISATALNDTDFGDVSRGNYYWPTSGRREVLEDKMEGVRILASNESLVYAVRDGKVMWKGPYRSYGVVALVASNDGYVYLYGGNVHFLVNTGQDIRKGEPLGKVDSGVENQLAGQSQIYQGENAQLALASRYPSQVYFSVFRNGEFIPIQTAPRG
ncbi:M23 family metallopeptidase [Candidatus Haliotispira prima]|uniref:M23 family metallopeptidase n=1 Tax=Candidatus Haliotispira prima TaxID=3034016 RepID=A0ABY8MHH8_9SPIO|nr:M23 family metallopeptidase [Candidatus Haliotispira prima]